MVIQYILSNMSIVVASAALFLVFVFLISQFKNRVSGDKFDQLHRKISDEIRSSVTPKFMTVTVEANEITDLAIEIWRIEQRVSKSASSIPEDQLKGLENSIEKMKRYLTKYDIEVVDHTNQKYNDGLNVDILDVEKDITLPESIIKKTVEPTVMLKGQVVRKAKIILLSNH